MKVRVLSSFCLTAGHDTKDGEILDLPVERARPLIYSGLVESWDEPASPDAGDSPAPGPVEQDHPEGHADVVVHRDPKPMKPARGRKER